MNGDLSWYTLRLISQDQFYLSMQEGEQLAAKLMERRLGDQSPVFLETEDVSGTPIVFQANEVQSLFLNTPQTRAQDDHGVLSEIRQLLRQEEWEKGDSDT